ncbi:hypothetical protein Hdeb2414_s0023g00639971 [Helianthus debilis subsp. tardiflorus]
MSPLYPHSSQLYLLLSFSLSQYTTPDPQRFIQNHTSESPIQRPNFFVFEVISTWRHR